MRKSGIWFFFVMIFILGALSPTYSSVEAQTLPPEEPTRQTPCLPGRPCEDENGERYFIASEETLAGTNDIGDTDDYGYTLSSTTYSWIDASSGTDTGINEYFDFTGAITLPFSFPFYENSYSELHITGAGYLTFTDGSVNSFSTIPDERDPNNFISVVRQYFYYSGSKVYYKDFGTHFVVQWDKLKDDDGGVYTFEAVLYPNGNIRFQYKTMQQYYCSASGIENATGTDGLVVYDWCYTPVSSGTSVLFTKPGPSARLGAFPLYLGEFASSLDVDEFTFTLTNNGDLGADTYDMSATTAPLGGGWTVALFDAATEVPLSDTDGDGTIDSGSLAQGMSREILVRVSAPAGLTSGAAIKTYVDISSSLNPAKTKTVTIDSTVPAAFAQTHKKGDINTLRTDINWPVVQVEADIDTESWNIYEPAILETPDHNFVHVWNQFYWGVNTYGWELRYTMMDRFGQVIKAPATLSPILDVAGYRTDDGYPTLAVTQDGKIGAVWTRQIYSVSDGQYNYNIWFAVLNPSGTIAYGPVNLTNSNAWGSYQNGNRVQLYDPDISASSDNRFFITWEKYSQATDLEDIYYTIRQSTGTAVVPVTAMTASVPGSSYYYPNAQIALSENRFYMTYDHVYLDGQYYYAESLYRVFNSSGNTLVDPKNLGFFPDAAVQLSGGNILLAQSNGDDIRYQIRNGTTYALIYGSGALSHPSSNDFLYGSLAVTKDSNNRGILTWESENQRYLYYAYVQGINGALLSGPVIFQHTSDWFGLSYNGSSLTTNSWSPTSGVDLVGSFASELFGAGPGGVATLKLQYSNIGLETAEFPELTLTLPVGLVWDGDTSGSTPDLIGNTVVWQLPELEFGSSGEFTVYLAVDDAIPIPSFLDLSLTLNSEGTDANPSDNADTARVMVGLQVFLPLLLR